MDQIRQRYPRLHRAVLRQKYARTNFWFRTLEAVRIALSSGLPRAQIASDLGVELSTLGKWVSQYRPTDLVSAPQADLARENERLRLENRILKEERDI